MSNKVISFAEALGKAIRHKRERLGYSCRQLADKANVSRNSVYHWEHGRAVPAVDAFYRICEVLKTDPNAMIRAIEIER